MPTIDEIQHILHLRELNSFIGLREDLHFDAKSIAYDLGTSVGRWDLAKDASAMANAEGGFIIVGLNSEPIPEEQTDRVTQVALLPQANFNVPQIEGVLTDHPMGRSESN